MRPAVGIGLTCLAAVAAGSLSAVSAGSAGSDGLTRDSLLTGADFNSAFAGGGAAAAPADDPDAPIKTARYDTAPPPVELAGAPILTTDTPKRVVTPAEPPPLALAQADARPAEGRVYTIAEVSPPSARPAGGARIVALAASALNRSGFHPDVTPRGSLVRQQRVNLSLTGGGTPFTPGGGLRFGVRDAEDNPAAPRIPPKTKLFDTRSWGLQFDLNPNEARKGRWFAFAATSGDAFGFNLFGDPARSGVKRNRWSVERLAELGKFQLGLGWRKGPTQVSVAATRREIGAYGYSKEDTVFGVTFSVSGGKRLPAPKARRGMNAEP